MPNPKTCSNVQILDIEKGILIPASRAYHEQTPQYIDTSNSTYHLKDDLVPVPGCADGNCSGSDCPEGRELAYLSLISRVRMSVPSAGNLSVTLIEAMFSDNMNTPAQVPVYKIDFGDGVGYHVIALGGTYVLDVSLFPDGLYTGNIIEENSGAQFEFFYNIEGGIASDYMRERIADIQLDFECSLYPNYTVGLSDSLTIQNGGSVNYKANHSEVKVFQTIVDEDTYIDGGTETYTSGGTLETDLVDIPAPGNLINTASINTAGDIQNIGKLLTQCINT